MGLKAKCVTCASPSHPAIDFVELLGLLGERTFEVNFGFRVWPTIGPLSRLELAATEDAQARP
jgi:hypothetical protein